MRTVWCDNNQVEEILVEQSAILQSFLVLVVLTHFLQLVDEDFASKNVLQFKYFEDAPVVHVVLQEELVEVGRVWLKR